MLRAPAQGACASAPGPRAQAAVPRVGDARPDWQIVRALSEVAGAPLPYDSDEGVRARLAELAPHLGRVAATERPLWLNGEYFKARPARPRWLRAPARALVCSLSGWLRRVDALQELHRSGRSAPLRAQHELRGGGWPGAGAAAPRSPRVCRGLSPCRRLGQRPAGVRARRRLRTARARRRLRTRRRSRAAWPTFTRRTSSRARPS